jgi:ATP-dependent Clp protease adaptor protein ClpS
MKINEVYDDYDLADVVRDPEEKIKPKLPKSYSCVLHNDDYTDGEALIELISKHFEQPREDAMRIVVSAHREGSAACGGPYTKDIAETKSDQAMKAAEMHPSIGGGPAPLLITVEEFDNG